MKKVLSCAATLLVALLAGCSPPPPVVYVPPPPPVLDFQMIQRQGFDDGFAAARHDVEMGRPPVFDHHPRWRRPPVPPPGFEAYRHGFRDGYVRFLHPVPGA